MYCLFNIYACAPSLTSSNWIERSQAVKQINDQKVLEKIALKDQHYSVRWDATKKLTNQEVLKKIALEDQERLVRGEAIERLTSQETLGQVAMEEQLGVIQDEAIKRIVNQKVLENIALKGKSIELRLKATAKLTYQEALKKIALEDKAHQVRAAAAAKLIDQEVLEKIALQCKHKHDKICVTAFNLLTDPSQDAERSFVSKQLCSTIRVQNQGDSFCSVAWMPCQQIYGTSETIAGNYQLTVDARVPSKISISCGQRKRTEKVGYADKVIVVHLRGATITDGIKS